MRKNLIKIALFACLILITIANIVYYTGHKEVASGGADSRQRPAADINAKSAENNALLSSEEQIHGQIIYDTRTALPPQAVLDIKLTESDSTAQQSAIMVAEIRQQLSGRSPLNWTLPIPLKSLDAQKFYNLQAKISSGDTLLFVNADRQPVDHNRAAYIVRLAKIDGGAGDISNKSSITGQNWVAESFLGKTIEPHSEISLHIDEEAKTDPAEMKKRYPVSGSGGCNRYMGSAFIDEDKKTMQFSPLITTFIACVPDIARQEADFIDMMSKVRSYQLDETGVLYLLDEGQNPLGRFIAR